MSNEEKFPLITSFQTMLGTTEGPHTREDAEYASSLIGRDPPKPGEGDDDDYYLCAACEEADRVLPGHFKCAF